MDVPGFAALRVGILAAALAGCGSDGPDDPPAAPAFTITSPDITVAAGEAVSYCYYFRTPNTGTMKVKSWATEIPSIAGSMIVTLTENDEQAPGTLTTSNCGGITPGSGTALPLPVFIAYGASSAYTFPADDGTGKPVAYLLAPNQAAFVRVYLVNPGSTAITASVKLTVTGYDPDTDVTRSDPFVTYNANLFIPANSTASAEYDCDIPASANVFYVTTYSHKQSVQTFVGNGANPVFQGTDFSNPGALSLTVPPFVQFATGKLRYRCDYANSTSTVITSGSNESTDETCTALAYYFPSTSGTYCVNSTSTPTTFERGAQAGRRLKT